LCVAAEYSDVESKIKKRAEYTALLETRQWDVEILKYLRRSSFERLF
jgi:hypothetical protein